MRRGGHPGAGTVERSQAGDHTIVLLRLHVVDHAAHDDSGSPLIFHRSGFGTMAVTD